MLDKLPAPVRHAALVLICALLTWLGESVPSLDLPAVVATVLAAAVTVGLTWLTPLVRQYGVGASDDESEGA